MKHPFLHNLLLMILAIVFVIGGSYVLASPWTARPSPDGNSSQNTPFPLTVGSTSQSKSGDLTLDRLVVGSSASLGGSVFIQGFAKGGKAGETVPSRISFGDAAAVTTSISGGLRAKGNIKVNDLSNATNSKVCADANGNLVLCTAGTVDLCSNEPGDQTTLPAGWWRNEDGTCGHPQDVCTNLPGPEGDVPPNYIQRPDGTCYTTKTITAFLTIPEICNASFPNEFDVGWNNNLSRTGYFTAGIKFVGSDGQTLVSLPKPTTMSIKLCSSLPGSKSQFIGQKTFPNEEVVCQGAPDDYAHYSDLSNNHGVIYTFIAPYVDFLNNVLNASKADPIVVDIPSGTTTFTIPEHFMCEREGKGGDLIWSYINDLSVQFTPVQTTDLEWTINFVSHPPIQVR